MDIEVYINREEPKRHESAIDWCISWIDDDVDSVKAQEARAELATLRAENVRLREALVAIRDYCGSKSYALTILAKDALK